MSCDNKDPPKPKTDPCEPKDKIKKVDVCESEKPPKKSPESDSCDKLYPTKGFRSLIKKKEKSTAVKKGLPAPSCQKQDGPKKPATSLKDKIKLPTSASLKDKIKLPTNLIGSIKDKIPEVNIKELKNIEYRKYLNYGFCIAKKWIIENCNPKNIKKMADKGSGAPARPMKFPYTFSAKFAQFPMAHYVKNQWIWKYYVLAFAACIPVFYSINKLANSPGNVAKWAEIRRKEAAEHHH